MSSATEQRAVYPISHPDYPIRGHYRRNEPPPCNMERTYLPSACPVANFGKAPTVCGREDGCAPDPNQCVHDYPLDRAEQALTKIAEGAYQSAAQQVGPSLIPEECCDQPTPCPLHDEWNMQFKNCPTTWVNKQCRMYKKDPRVWNADLNEALYERKITSGAKWDPYKHFHARQSWLQFLSTEWQSRRDNYMRPIHGMEDAYCIKAERKYPNRNMEPKADVGLYTPIDPYYPVACNTTNIMQQTI